jgi:hypothetical protein
MDKEIKRGEKKAFSNEDIERLCEGEINIHTYPELAMMSSLDQLLNSKVKCDAAIILYMSKPAFGHWVCIFKTPGDPETIEFFDSYGYSPDDELKMINESYREQSNQDSAYLSALIMDALQDGYIKQVIYNKTKLQNDNTSIATCGRWAGLRIAMKEVPLKKFQSLFTNQTFNPDWYVSALTMFV